MPTLFSGICCCLLHERWSDCDGGGVSERERHWNGIRKVSKTIHRFVIVWLKMSEIESMSSTSDSDDAPCCPLCANELDDTDQSLFPCSCNCQV